MSLLYLLGAVLSLPLLPWMYVAGKKVRREVPTLEVPTDTTGEVGTGAEFNLLVIGESTMAGVGADSHRLGFTGRLAYYLSEILGQKVQYEVVARSGYTAKMVVERLLPKLATKQPQLIVIGLGANDAFTLNTPWKWRQAVTQLIEKLQDKYQQAPIHFINMPPIKEFPALPPVLRWTVGNLVDIFGSELGSLVAKYERVYYHKEKIRLSTWGKKYKLTADPSTYFSDGIHPAMITYDLWARDTSAYVMGSVPILKSSRSTS